MVLTFNFINLGGLTVGASPTVAINRQAGGPIDGTTAPRELHIPFHDLNAKTDVLSLLSWQTAISGFFGRDSEMAALMNWADRKQNASVKFLIGEGGIGKTRLAAEFGRELRKKGWDAGMVRLEETQVLASNKGAVLLIVDYPEEQLEAVKRLLAYVAKLELDQKLRILLLTRQSMEAWFDIVTECGANVICDFEPSVLGTVNALAAHELYSSALEKASANQGTTPLPLSEKALEHWLSESPENTRTLFIVAAAVYGALHPEDYAVTYGGPEIIASLVAREDQRLAAISRDHGLEPSSLAKLLTLAAVTGGLEKAKIEALEGFGDPESLLRAAISAGYGSDGAVAALTPDIVAADHVIRTLMRAGRSGRDLLWMGVASDDPVRAVGRLGRISYDAELVLGRLEIRLGDCLAAAIEGDFKRCESIMPAFLDTRLPMSLAKCGVATWRTLTRQAGSEEVRAVWLNNLSVDLSASGDAVGALEAVKEAVEIQRRLSTADTARFEPNLAKSLHTLSNRLLEFGEAAGALEAVEEAVEIFLRLASANAAHFEPDLVVSLHTLSNRLSESGDTAGALEAVKIAVEIQRRLAMADTARFEPNLAMSLHTHSNRLSESGDSAGALEAVEEAVEIFQRLATANAARFEPDQAKSLQTLSNQLSESGEAAGALEAAKEAVEIFQRLATANAAHFEPYVASSLHTLSNRLSKSGDAAGALKAVEEAVEIRRRLASANAARFEPDLAWSLGVLSDRLREQGMHKGALASTQEGIEILAPYAERWPEGVAALRLAILNKDRETLSAILES